MASAGSIFVDLLLRDTQYASGWNKVRNTTRQSSNQVQGDLGKIGSSFNSTINPLNNFASAASKLTGILAGAFSVQKIVEYSDQYKQLEGRLSLVTSSTDDLVRTQQSLLDIAQRTRQPLSGVLNLYTRLAQAIPESQRGNYDLLGVTESINQALSITGEGSAQAASAILQFTQAVASGFQASSQEINSLLDSAPRLAIALQRSFGDGSKSLKQLSADGELSLDVILKSLAAVGYQGEEIREEFAKIPVTVGQAFTKLNNAFLVFIGGNSEVSRVTGLLSNAVSRLAENLDLAAKAIITVGTALLVSGLSSLLKYVAAQAVARREIAATAAAAAAQAAAFDKLSASLVTNARLTAALAKQQAAAAGSVGASAIIVNRAGVAAAVTADRMGLISRSIAGVGVAARGLVGFLGGPVGAFVTLGAVAFTFREQLLEAADGINVFGTSVGDILRDIGEGAVITFNFVSEAVQNSFETVSRTITPIFAGVLSSIDGLLNASKIKLFDFIQTINSIPGVNIGDEFLLSGLSAPGALESGARSIAENYRIGADRAIAQINASRLQVASPIQSPDLNVRQSRQGAATSGVDKETLKELDRLYQRHRALILGIDNDTLRYIETEKELEKLFQAQRINANEYYTALSKLDEQYQETGEKAYKFGIDVEEFGKQAARNLQDTFADFLFDPFSDGLDGILAKFGETLRRMAAEAAAQSILRNLFSEGGLGSFGGIFGAIGNGLAGARAAGGHVQAGSSYLVGERGMEVFTPTVSGTIIPNNALGGGGGVVVNIINNGNSEVTTREGTNGAKLDVIIDEIVSQNLSTRGTNTNRSFEALASRSAIRR